MARSWNQFGHLVGRFVRSFDRQPPAAEDEAWVAARLRPEEFLLWQAQLPSDRKHTLAVARSVASAGDAPDWVVGAALLHDIGKVDARLGPIGRSVATVLELVGIRRAPGIIGRYLAYQGHGAAMLSAIGADPLVVAWARDHHRAERAWGVPLRWGRILRAADDLAD